MSKIEKDLGASSAYAYAVQYGEYTGTEEEYGREMADLANISAEAETLSPDEEASASYSGGVLSFGIPQGVTGNGIASAVLNSDFTLTLTFTDGTTYTTPTPIRGETGAKGDTGETGATGATGNGIASIAKTGTSGLVDTYTITFTDGTATTFTVTNGTSAIDDTLSIAGRAADAKAVGDAVNDLQGDLSKNNVKTETVLQDVNGNMVFNPDNFELGNITINPLGWTYSNSAWRVRTKQNYDLELEFGDIIRIKDPTKASLYIGFKTSETTYGATVQWVSEFICTYGGQYALVIKQLPTESAQESKDALLSQLEIIKYNNIQQNTIINASKNVAIVSANHRGMNRNAPENTIPAFMQSKDYGFDYVETDICWTSDGVPVLLHDATINRTARNSDGTQISETINIADITYEQALTYDFGIWKGAKWAGTKIPTFEELLIMCKKQGIKVLAEAKSTGISTDRLNELISITKNLGAESLVMWISFEYSVLAYIKNLVDYAPLGLLSATVAETPINNALALKTSKNNVVLMSSSYTEQSVNLCQNAGVPLWAYIIDDKTVMNNLPLYLCGVTSNFYPVNVVWYESLT